jgi:hypothetical protein
VQTCSTAQCDSTTVAVRCFRTATTKRYRVQPIPSLAKMRLPGKRTSQPLTSHHKADSLSNRITMPPLACAQVGDIENDFTIPHITNRNSLNRIITCVHTCLCEQHHTIFIEPLACPQVFDRQKDVTTKLDEAKGDVRKESEILKEAMRFVRPESAIEYVAPPPFVHCDLLCSTLLYHFLLCSTLLPS